jgi:hypothetical protein
MWSGLLQAMTAERTAGARKLAAMEGGMRRALESGAAAVQEQVQLGIPRPWLSTLALGRVNV